MLTPGYLKTCGDDLVRLYQQLEDDIVRDAARRIVKMDFSVTDAARWQIERLQQSGAVYEDMIKSLSKYTGKSEREIKKLLQSSSVQSLVYDDAIYKKAGLLPPPLSGSPLLMQHITAAVSKTSNSFKNLTMTTAVKSQADFINACDRAYMQVSSGTLDYVTAVKWAVKSVSDTGASVLYPSGRSDKPDVAVRRAVLTGVSQTGNELQILRMDEMGCTLVETTAHFGARPTHTVWQGRVYSRNGDTSKYPDFIASTGYGSGDGLGGWNCRHGFFPFFEGFSQRAYTDGQLRDRENRTVTYDGQTYTDYEASQIQRKFERDIRAKKRELVGFDTAANASADARVINAAKAEFASASVKLKDKESKLADFLHQTGRDIDTVRQQVQGFGRSQAQKAVWANKKEIDIRRMDDIIKNNSHLPKKAKLPDEKIKQTVDVALPLIQGVVPKNANATNVYVMAGKSTSTRIKDIRRLSNTYGGRPANWQKKSADVYGENFKYVVHWYENNGIAPEQEFKIKGVKKL